MVLFLYVLDTLLHHANIVDLVTEGLMRKGEVLPNRLETMLDAVDFILHAISGAPLLSETVDLLRNRLGGSDERFQSLLHCSVELTVLDLAVVATLNEVILQNTDLLLQLPYTLGHLSQTINELREHLLRVDGSLVGLTS